MAYEKQNFENGNVLDASELNHIEEGIVALETAVDKCLASESDPTVPEWAKQPQKPKYTASEVEAQPLEMVDRSTDKKYRLYVDNGELLLEET